MTGSDKAGQQYFSGATNHCTVPGCTSVPITITSPAQTTIINYTYDPLYRLTQAKYSTYGGVPLSAMLQQQPLAPAGKPPTKTPTPTRTATPTRTPTTPPLSTARTFTYTYDAVGNRSTQNDNGTTTNYVYDNANRLTSVNGQAYTWDANGNLLNDGTRTFTYDQANRLKTVTQGANNYAYAYNGVGDRLRQTANGATTNYALDLNTGLTQVLADGSNTYLYGNGRIAQYQTAMQYFGADGLGSVRQMYNTSGQVIANTRYDPYGNVVSTSGSATSVYGFTGEQTDATGLTYLRARYYASAQGRFTTRDTWEGDYNAPLSLNRWNYTEGNPVNYADPSGRCPLCVLAALGILALVTSGCTTPPVDTPLPPVSPILPPTVTKTPTLTPPPTNTPTATPTLAPATRGTQEYELAKMMWFEERDQGREAMRAVGWVAVNRVGQPRDDGSRRNFPAALQEVLDEPRQFQGYENNSNTDPATRVATRDSNDADRQTWGWVVQDAPSIVARRIPDPTGGAKYFGNGDRVSGQMSNCRQTVPGFESGQIRGTTLYFSNKPYTNCPVPTPTRR